MDLHPFIPPDLDASIVQPLPRVDTTIGSPGQVADEDICLVEDVADTLRLGQSYRSIGFDGERAIVHKALADRSKYSPTLAQSVPEYHTVLRKNIKHVKILTAEARRRISDLIHHKLHGGKPEACEPPYMLPSEDKDDYPAVCSALTYALAPSD